MCNVRVVVDKVLQQLLSRGQALSVDLVVNGGRLSCSPDA